VRLRIVFLNNGLSFIGINHSSVAIRAVIKGGQESALWLAQVNIHLFVETMPFGGVGNSDPEQRLV
jgi:hypothetical protein